MTKDTLENYVCAMNKEHDAFWTYIELVEEDPENKSILLSIASDEIQHFDKLRMYIFKQEDKTDLESAMCKEYANTSAKMKKVLDAHK